MRAQVFELHRYRIERFGPFRIRQQQLTTIVPSLRKNIERRVENELRGGKNRFHIVLVFQAPHRTPWWSY